LGVFREKKFGLQGQIDPHILTNQLNYCEIVSTRLRRQTETRLYGGEGGIRTFGVSLFLNGLESHHVQIVSTDFQRHVIVMGFL